MNLFYIPEIAGTECILDEKESGHIHKVLRKQVGDTLKLTDGKGYFYEAEILEADKRRCRVKVISKEEGNDKREYKLHIAIAPTKNMDRLEWFVEKSTEIGIDEISIINCFHSERKVVKNERLEKIKIAACKQSLKSNFPRIHEMRKFGDFISQDFPGYKKYIAYIDDEVKHTIRENYSAGENVIILIGPEGDFSKQEVEGAKKHGYLPISLGRSRLRTETAGVVACQTVSLMNDEK